MSRLLPLLAVQAESRFPADAVAQLRRDLLELLEEFPETRLVVYPEYHCCRVEGGPKQRADEYDAMAEPLDGARVTALRELASEAGVWLVPGTVVERAAGGELFNTAVAISPEGELVAAYRKIFPWRPFEPFDPGTRFVTFDLPGLGRLGLCICYDLWFPEVIRHLAWMGAELVVIPTQTSTRDRAEELVLTQASAIQNQVFVLAANAAAPVGTGRSILVDPEGLVRFQAPSEAAACLTDVIDLDSVTKTREFGTCGLNRMWSQPRPGDQRLDLPLYAGTLDPTRWQPDIRNGDGHGHR
jgi:predicted amidohydrolase